MQQRVRVRVQVHVAKQKNFTFVKSERRKRKSYYYARASSLIRAETPARVVLRIWTHRRNSSGMGLFDDNYVCSLSADTAKFAKEDLREDQATREHGIKAMREWLTKNPDIKNCRSDAVFLLRFLRCRKFSVPQAQELLERYLAIRQTYPHWFRNLDVNEADLLEIIDAGYIVPLPEKDCFGRQIILTRSKCLDAMKFNSTQMARLHSLVVEVLMDDEESQVRGFVHVNDEDGLSMSHLSMWSLADVRTMMNCIQKSTPMRLKGTHFINLPGIANAFFEFFISLLNDKLRGRIQVTARLIHGINTKTKQRNSRPTRTTVTCTSQSTRMFFQRSTVARFR
ncbi:Hypothetical predicted protein [Cloeon dipterum]|uniref:CRAL-TRIO domain-containing protein n=1 Tax=Cloeon dipterum TaxID=197152 RepID=A0A8S1DC07_9INSE|nr:Hypothetical predicted protein [Cloeon dipterum]